MADGHITLKGCQGLLSKGLGNQTHTGVNLYGLAVRGGDTSALLASVLEGEKTKKGHTCCVAFWRIYRYHPAFFPGMVWENQRL